MGIVSEVDASYNFRLNGETGTALPQGAPVAHNYGLHEYEFYAQDSWKIKPNLTFTYGLRYLFMTPPWDTGGQEVAPYYQNSNGQRINSLTPWFQQRYQNMLNGIPFESGPARLLRRCRPFKRASGSLAQLVQELCSAHCVCLQPPHRLVGCPFSAPGDKTVIRVGFGTYYDHFGEGMLSTFTGGGSFGSLHRTEQSRWY